MTGKMLTAAVAASLLSSAAAAPPAEAHNDWGLPLVGGLVGGYAINSLMHRPDHEKAAPAPAPPPAAAAGSQAATIEQKLNTLDQLAAKGYITKDEYNARREALLNQL